MFTKICALLESKKQQQITTIYLEQQLITLKIFGSTRKLAWATRGG